MPVGSMPYLMRSGLPVATLRSSFLRSSAKGSICSRTALDQGKLFIEGLHNRPSVFSVQCRVFSVQ